MDEQEGHIFMILLASTADTDLLAAIAASKQADKDVPPVTTISIGADPTTHTVPDLDGIQVVMVRLLGGRRAWAPFDAVRQSCVERGIPFIAMSGEVAPDAELTGLSTVPSAVVAQCFDYLVKGGVRNAGNLLAFLTDTLLMGGVGFEDPVDEPMTGVYGEADADPSKPTVGIVFYRSHFLSNNTAFVDALIDGIHAHGCNAVAVYTYSLRPDPETGRSDALDLLASHQIDALLVGMFAMGGTIESEEGAWTAQALLDLGVPVIQAIAATSSAAEFNETDRGLSPMDTAMYIALPEFDGRIIGVPTSFKEQTDAGAVYVPDAERSLRVAGIAARHAKLRHIPVEDRKLCLVLSNYPSKHSRIGNAVGLDTPQSAVAILNTLTEQGWNTGHWKDEPLTGDQLIHQLIEAGGFDTEFLTEAQLAGQPHRIDAQTYQSWFDALPAGFTEPVVESWGPPPGEVLVHDGDLVFATRTFGNVTLAVQPPRGFGENPVAIYHDPDLPPSHQYLAFYRWVDNVLGADAILHLGKHGTLEWMPGKGAGLSASCGPDAILGDLPFVYPFVVNDPGEGTQAKRRAHATIVDHMVPPMTRAETYDELTQLEQLLDEYYHIDQMDPAKVQAVQGEIWQLLRSAELVRDLKFAEHGDDIPEDLDDLIVDVDGYLCEIKDAQIRGGLHILGHEASETERIDLVLAILRLPQGGHQGLRATVGAHLGVDEAALLQDAGAKLAQPMVIPPSFDELDPARLVTNSDAIDALEAIAREMIAQLESGGYDPDQAAEIVANVMGEPHDDLVALLRFACEQVVPRLGGVGLELERIHQALSGAYIPAGPSGSPTRGRLDVLPTGKNFYSVDPKALPSELSWQVGQRLADDLIKRHIKEEGEPPKSVGIVVWGTAAMRTHGDDIAEILALYGVRPTWHHETRRVTGLELISLEELGRPRVDVTVRISGFFRDAFPHLVELIDQAARMVASADEPEDQNPIRAHVNTDVANGADAHLAGARVYGSKPGAYGAGLLPLIDAHNWTDDADLAAVYTTWGGYAYGGGLEGVEAPEAMNASFARIQIAVKNTDTREHDLLDSDDYFQYHGGMVATVRNLTDRSPKAYIGDSSDPSRVKTRDLAEETARVFRARVANPKWIEAMKHHGYKGAFEMSATVDYMFGYDATTGVVEDWMYETLTNKYVLDPDTRAFMEESNPWALRAIAERLLEAADRGLWEEPKEETLDALREAYLASEGDLEADE
ncbi:cobaltochelatase subunit CobN [Stomatohabitans albus]|uniref:cobaltochelatase subunit CobN n=1 Tax=Stomatohabitans albus TaxID=3110766 RepID=UPI00300D780D